MAVEWTVTNIFVSAAERFNSLKLLKLERERKRERERERSKLLLFFLGFLCPLENIN